MNRRRLRGSTLLLGIAAGSVFASAAASFAQYGGTTLYQVGTPAGATSISVSSASTTSVGGAFSVNDPYNPYTHATYWTTAAPNGIDLTPSGSPYGADGAVTAVAGNEQGGEVGVYQAHAAVWFGTPQSYVDLTPGGIFFNSNVTAVSGNQQVGYAQANPADVPRQDGVNHALLWSSSAASCVDLTPVLGPYNCEAYGTNGHQQVGDYANSAALWSGTASSYVPLESSADLAVENYSEAFGISPSGKFQVGLRRYNYAGFSPAHAILWSGTTGSGIDLDPNGYFSEAVATTDTMQVGDAIADDSSNNQATVWFGTAASKTDLGGLLPFAALSSYATAIDASGNIFGYATDAAGNDYAVEWSTVPEPATVGIAAIGMLGFLGRRRRLTENVCGRRGCGSRMDP